LKLYPDRRDGRGFFDVARKILASEEASYNAGGK